MSIRAVIDQPAADSLADPLALSIEGWLHAGERHRDLIAVEIRANGRSIGRTTLFFSRPDVEAALQLPAATHTGFALLVNQPGLLSESHVRLECHAHFYDGTVALGCTSEVRLISHDHRTNHYGLLVQPDESRLFHRNDIYTSGPSSADLSLHCLALIRRYLGAAPTSVLDVGCGLGNYGRVLLEEGYEWLGAEVKPSDCAELARAGLPHRQIDGRTLPFDAGAFANVMCIEVLEHIAEPASFLAEIRRVARKRFLVSVPNAELIPYLHRFGVVPWHMLEGDHKNFFTRSSLRRVLGEFFRNVEVLTYGPLPLSSPEGLPLHNHLFAICEV